MSSGGMKGVRVDASTPGLTSSELKVKWEAISSQNNFRYGDDEITAWRAYGVGAGKLVHKGGVSFQGRAVMENLISCDKIVISGREFA